MKMKTRQRVEAMPKFSGSISNSWIQRLNEAPFIIQFIANWTRTPVESTSRKHPCHKHHHCDVRCLSADIFVNESLSEITYTHSYSFARSLAHSPIPSIQFNSLKLLMAIISSVLVWLKFIKMEYIPEFAVCVYPCAWDWVLMNFLKWVRVCLSAYSFYIAEIYIRIYMNNLVVGVHCVCVWRLCLRCDF